MADNADASREDANEPLERYRIRFGLYKVILGTGIVGLAGVLVPGAIEYWQIIFEERRLLIERDADQFKRQQDHIKDFLDTALNQDIELRIRFSEYFANVATEPYKKGWEDFFSSLKNTRDKTRNEINTGEDRLLKLLAIDDPSVEEQIELARFQRELEWRYREIGYVPKGRSIVPSESEKSETVSSLSLNRVVAEATAPIDGGRENCRSRECEIGNLVTEAMLHGVKSQGVSIAIHNGGGLRASIDAGPITMREVLTVLPFGNTLSIFQLTGSDIVVALESGVSRAEQASGRFPQVAGLRYSYSLKKRPNEGRVSAVEVMKDGAWTPIDQSAVYGVASTSYLRGGGDGYVIFAKNAQNPYDFGPTISNVVAEFLAAGGPYTPIIDGRITVVD